MHIIHRKFVKLLAISASPIQVIAKWQSVLVRSMNCHMNRNTKKLRIATSFVIASTYCTG